MKKAVFTALMAASVVVGGPAMAASPVYIQKPPSTSAVTPNTNRFCTGLMDDELNLVMGGPAVTRVIFIRDVVYCIYDGNPYLLSRVSAAQAQQTATSTFADLGGLNEMDQSSIGLAYDLGLTNGTGPRTFSPYQQMTLAQAETVVERLFAMENVPLP